MTERPYVLVSCAMSVDGRIDNAGPQRLILSGEADLDRVDEVRAGCDAIMVGAATIRRDDPRLVIRSAERRARRAAAGATGSPVKVTLTASGNLDPAARFFTTGDSARLVYCARPALAAARARLSGRAEVIDAGDPPSLAKILKNLAERGIARLLLEGGGRLATEFLTAGLADELHLAVAPFFVGDPAAPRFAGPGRYPNGPDRRMQLAEVRQLDDVVLLCYLLTHGQPPGSPGSQAAAGRHEPDHRYLPGTRTVAEPASSGLSLPRPAGPARDSSGPVPHGGADLHAAPPPARPADDHPSPDPHERADLRGGPSPASLAVPGENQPAAPGADTTADLRDLVRQDSQGAPGLGRAALPCGRADDLRWLGETIELARRCPPSLTAFSVGAVIVGADGGLLATGFSREGDRRDHAEEAALAKLPAGDPRLAGATIYSSLEPCGVRASRPHPCAELIIAAGLRRVVYAWQEPPLLAPGGGAAMLSAAGVSVTQVPELAAEARAVNAHLTGTA